MPCNTLFTRGWRSLSTARFLLWLLVAGLGASAQAVTAVMIWPVDPVMEHDQNAVALWVENRDQKPVTLQVRAIGWRQEDFQDVYDEDQDVVAVSPAMATVQPGKRQLIRLIRLKHIPADKEAAFRILVDEIPQPERRSANVDGGQTGGAAFGVKLRMRYSIPLFVTGTQLWTKPNPAKTRAAASMSVPTLNWRVEKVPSEPRHNGVPMYWMVLRNTGPVHARLSKVRIHDGETLTELTPGLFGYVLPGASMRWEIPRPSPWTGKEHLQAMVNYDVEVQLQAD